MFRARLLAPLLACLLSTANAAETLNIANWNDYIDPEVLSDFTRETGIPVNYRTYKDDQEVSNMLKVGTLLDIVVPSTDNFGKLIRDGLLRPVDAASLPGFSDLDPAVMLRLKPHDPQRQYGIPYLWGNVGIAVNVKKAEAALGGPLPKSWSLLFDAESLAKLKGCGVTLLDSSNDVLTLLLHYSGSSLASGRPGEIRRALRHLESVWPHYRYADSVRYIDDIQKGNVCVSMAWEGDGRAAARANPDVKFILPEEGTEIFMDVVAVPATARNLDEARAFMSYLLRPEVAVKIARFTRYHTASLKAQKQMHDSGELTPEESRLEVRQFTYQTPSDKVQGEILETWRRLQNP